MATVKRASHLAWRKISGQAYIIHTRTSILHELSDTGTFIWELLSKEETPESIAEQLSETYDVAPEKARADVEEFLEELEQKGLIVRTEHSR